MWNTVLKRRQRTAVARKTKMGHLEMSWGLSVSGCSSMGLKMLESRCFLSAWACVLREFRKV